MENVKATILLSILCLPCAFGFAAGEEGSSMQGAGAALFLSSDNEGFSTRRIATQYLPSFRHGDALTGFRYASHYFEQDEWERSGHQLSLMYRNVEPATATGSVLEAGVFQQGGHELLTLDGSWRKLITERTGLEFIISRDWVETPRALDQGTHFTFVGASLDQGIGPHVTLMGLVGRQEFSDDNARNHGRIRLVVQPDLDLGLTLQLRYRTFNSARDDVDGAYFNPSDYHEAILALGWRRRFHGWMSNVVIGTGRQKVADAPRTPSHLLGISLHSPANKSYSFRLHAGINQSASFNGPNYRFRYAQAELIIGF